MRMLVKIIQAFGVGAGHFAWSRSSNKNQVPDPEFS